MADIPFNIGGHDLPCPDYDKSDFSQLGDIAYQYLDGSPLYLGMPSITYVWPNILPGNVVILRGLYDTLVTGVDLTVSHGTPLTLTVPDYANSGLRTTTAFMLEPSGTARGDGTMDLKITFTNLHEGALQTALAATTGNLYDAGDKGLNVNIGAAKYPGSITWQF